jgi:hypothetical protein
MEKIKKTILKFVTKIEMKKIDFFPFFEMKISI